MGVAEPGGDMAASLDFGAAKVPMRARGAP